MKNLVFLLHFEICYHIIAKGMFIIFLDQSILFLFYRRKVYNKKFKTTLVENAQNRSIIRIRINRVQETIHSVKFHIFILLLFLFSTLNDKQIIYVKASFSSKLVFFFDISRW